ncbi:MAG: tetratricopeptide repeat protein, partial [Bacteroidetes bacterium]|nr:tetratricopeptide repeat protein [Bacteroidota bacterium]
DKKEYTKALPYLEYYVAKNEKVRREDLYQLAFCYYSAKSWDKCIEGFKQLGGKEDSLAQNSMYLLADAYLKTSQKANARNAFLFCASNTSNKVQKEVSAFNYAKLSEELGYVDIAVKELQSFISEYPKSPYLKESKELMFVALANTSNYKDALDMFDNIEKTETVKKVYPKILYARAVELINERRLDIGDSLLDILLKTPYNNQQIQLANFWKGEIAYRNGNIDNAIIYYKNYLQNTQANAEVNAINAKYNLGYCYLKKENYAAALQNFEHITKQVFAASTSIEQDAYLRSADCYFMTKQFATAQKMYDNVIAQNLKTADYALYQKAVIAGAQGKSNEKISLLQSLPKQYPNSSFGAEALMEIANTYIFAKDYDNAISILSTLVKSNAASTLYPQAYLKLGLSNFNLDKNEEALKQFSYLSKQYPNSQEADESIEYIRNIFVETQRPEEFINFMKQNGKLISYSEEDSLTYRSAQLRFQDNDTANAAKGYKNYLYKFPDGKYYLQANYILAEMNIDNKNKLAALPYYELLASKAPNKYAERSALQSARIYYFEKQDYAKAQQYFAQTKTIATQQENKLEAMRGLLRCQYKQQLWADAQTNAKELLAEKAIAVDDKMMANLIIAKANQLQEKFDDAITAYKQALSIAKNEFSAEANYRIAEIQYLQGKLTDAEKTAFDAIKKFGSYEYWLTKNYILLGDIYFKQKDYFNAEATFKSIVEHAAIIDLKAEAQQKLANVIAEKDKVNKVETN